jgi:hypothetical protein
MLNDKHFKVLSYYSNSDEVFPNVDIKGGVAITLKDKTKDFGKIGIFTNFEELNTILQKVINNSKFESLSNIIYNQNKFNLEALYNDYPTFRDVIGSNGNEKRLTTSIFEQLSVFTKDSKDNNDICILGLIKNNRIYRFISVKYIESHKNTKKFKVILPKSNGSGAIGEVLSTPLIGEPLIGFTQSFISIGSFDNKEEAENCLRYVKSKFARTMLGILKITQDNNKDVWEYVPVQDFTSSSDIDWSTSISAIDQQLYAKYKLSAEEIEFIERMIKPMSEL